MDEETGSGLIEQEHSDYEGEEYFKKIELRYIGPDPKNYVWFNCTDGNSSGSGNCELWRIIGLVNTPEGQRIKLISQDYYNEYIKWDDNNINDWTHASLQETLNNEYYNTLQQTAKNMIDENITWNLGGTEDHESSNGLVTHFYGYERGTDTYDSNPTTWKTENGKIAAVGLMYPSDYGYATSGGSTVNRNNCLAKELFYWYDLDYCYTNDWLFDESKFQWTLTQCTASNGPFVFGVVQSGFLGNSQSITPVLSARPVVYLKESVTIETDKDTENINPNGSEQHPFVLSLSE